MCNTYAGVYVNMYTYMHADIYLSFPKYISNALRAELGFSPTETLPSWLTVDWGIAGVGGCRDLFSVNTEPALIPQ